MPVSFKASPGTISLMKVMRTGEKAIKSILLYTYCVLQCQFAPHLQETQLLTLHTVKHIKTIAP